MAAFSEKKHKVLTAGGGTEIVLKEFVYKADKPGQTLYVQSGLHGGETSQWCLHRLHGFLLEHLTCGEVHVVPYANPLAWMQRAYFSTFGKFSQIDGKDFNRCFPGNPDGDVSARLCAAIMKLATAADFVLDLHTSKSSNPFVIYTQKEYEPWVAACGLPYNQYSDDASIPGLQGTFNAALDRAGVKNLTIECGGHNEYAEAKIDAVFNAVCAVLNKLGLTEKGANTDIPAEIYRFEKRRKVFAAAGGLFRAEKALGAKVARGEVIGHIFDAGNPAVLSAVTAPADGILQILCAGHIVWEGDVVAEIVPAEDLKRIVS